MSQRVEAFRPPTLSSKPLNLTTSSTYLLKLVDADFALLSIDGEARAIGRLDPYPEALAVMAHIQSLKLSEIRCSNNLNEDFPGINFEGGVKTIAGLLFVPFHGGGGDFVIFFRKEQLKHLKWAG
jgi:light-regulated signal transduction histidine kinase (bacteriophytochrome)